MPAKSRAAKSSIPIRAIIFTIWAVIISVLLLLLLFKLKSVLLHITIAALLAIAIDLPISRLQQTGRFGRGLAVLIVSAALFIGTIAVSAAVAAPLATQAISAAQNAPTYIAQAEQSKGPLYKFAKRFHLQNQLVNSGPSLSKNLSHLSDLILSAGRRVASTALTTTIVIILALFMLIEGPGMVAGLINVTPEDYRESLRRVGATIKHVVSRYTLGLLFMGALNGLVTGVALALTGTPFAIPLAVWAAVTDLLPIVGGLVGLIPAALFAFIHGTTSGFIVVVAVLLYQQIKNHFLYPRIIGRAVQLNALVVLVAVLAGAEIGKISGAILAIPIVGAAHAVITEVVRRRRELAA
ncbi:MAG: AI-2E family transporter [Actinomycetota bacterium]